jgi:DNA-binding NarL/FixJ family response regulator
MSNKGASVMIVANRGPLRDGIHALLFAMPQIESITVVNDLQVVLGSVNGKAPSLILLDADLTKGKVPLVVRQIKTRWSHSRCIFLANDVRQQSDAEGAGVDAALLKGVPPARITATVVRLLAQRR